MTASPAQAAPLVNHSLSVVAMSAPTETATATGVTTATIADTATATSGAAPNPIIVTVTSGATVMPIAATPTVTPTPTSVAPPPSPTAASPAVTATATVTADETPVAMTTALPTRAMSSPTVGSPPATFAPITVTPRPTAQAGNVWAWGDISDGAGANRTPAPTGLTDVVGLAGGVGFHVALKSDGTVWSWGNNYYGELGNNSVTAASQYFAYPPVQVSGLTGVIAVATGYYHSLALKSDGTVWAWGGDSYGQLVLAHI